MNAARTEMTHHPEPETLAAFVDRRLNEAERQEVMKHMAECAECRDNVLLSTEVVAMEAPVVNVEALAANVVRPWFGWKTIVPLAAAASIAVVVAVPLFRHDPMRDAYKFAKTVNERPSDARLSLDIPYQSPKPRMRGTAEVGSPTTLYAAEDAQQRAAEKPTVKNLHAAGLLLMYAGKHKEAVAELERAVAADPNPSAALLNDLSAAYLSYGGSPQQALLNAERVWKVEQTPTAAWNRALALEAIGTRDAEARAAWEKYLEMEPNPEWVKEARERHLARF
jgi:tetratricopeptide (TPR) repeat protein